jgi:hypothetical protein
LPRRPAQAATLRQIKSLLADTVRDVKSGSSPSLQKLQGTADATYELLSSPGPATREQLAAARSDLAERVELLSAQLARLAAAKIAEPHPPQLSLAPVMAALRGPPPDPNHASCRIAASCACSVRLSVAGLTERPQPSPGLGASQARGMYMSLEELLHKLHESGATHSAALEKQLLGLEKLMAQSPNHADLERQLAAKTAQIMARRATRTHPPDAAAAPPMRLPPLPRRPRCTARRARCRHVRCSRRWARC